MFAIIGIIVVFGAVLGGYLMEHGSVAVLMQPAELLIIGGAAGGMNIGEKIQDFTPVENPRQTRKVRGMP